MKKFVTLLFAISLLVSCKKVQESPNNDLFQGYQDVISLQKKAVENYITWSKTMDSIEAVKKLYQFFVSDPIVNLATIGSQGVTVQYSNGMRGAILLNTKDDPGGDIKALDWKLKSSYSKSETVVNKKKAILISPNYPEQWWDTFTNSIYDNDNKYLPEVGITTIPIYDNKADLYQFTKLSDYGIIQIFTHGYPYPSKENISEVYLMTGEVVNFETSTKYLNDILISKTILIGSHPARDNEMRYWISKDFITKYNDFSKDTVLFVGAFCYSFFGAWPYILDSFKKGGYFGYDWSLKINRMSDWTNSLIFNMSTKLLGNPITAGDWINDAEPPKSFEDYKDNRTVRILYAGDPNLALWKASLPTVTTNPITDITSATAKSGGFVTGIDGAKGYGIVWSTTENPTLLNVTNNNITSDGEGLGPFTSHLDRLNANTQYHVRAYATNSAGTAYGNDVSFKTLSLPSLDGTLWQGYYTNSADNPMVNHTITPSRLVYTPLNLCSICDPTHILIGLSIEGDNNNISPWSSFYAFINPLATGAYEVSGLDAQGNFTWEWQYNLVHIIQFDETTIEYKLDISKKYTTPSRWGDFTVYLTRVP
jgi:hypothetical protein